MESLGEEYNSLVEVTDYDEDDEDHYRTLMQLDLIVEEIFVNIASLLILKFTRLLN